MVDVEHGYAGFQHDLPMKKRGDITNNYGEVMGI
jgi:hypothetical protein